MKLKEYEGKQILLESGIAVPHSILVSDQDVAPITGPVMIKPQILSGGRGKANLVRSAATSQEAMEAVRDLLGRMHHSERIEELLIEEKIVTQEEIYLSISFSTSARSPVLALSKHGGVDIEELKLRKHVHIKPIIPLIGLEEALARAAAKSAGLDETMVHVLIAAYHAFERYQTRLLEINPLAKVGASYIALDAKIVLDDDALKSIPRSFPRRTGQRAATPRELAARRIDADDYRGVAGKSFIELDGDIAVLASGGGASLTCMDALLSYGGKPANFVEYSGNPSAEKVRLLTLVTLDRPGLKGCWVVGGTANFTRIDDTIGGFIAALEDIRPQYPIVVRRAGPGDKEAFQMLKDAAAQHGWDIQVFGEEMPMTESAKILVERMREHGTPHR